MSRKLLAVLLSSAWLLTSVSASAAPAAEPAQPAQVAVPQTVATGGNQPPLPPGPARIRNAQGLEDDDLGIGVILGAAAVATALLFLMMFSDDDEDYTPPSTGS